MPVRVLVMDDEPIVRTVSAVMLVELGCNVRVAKNGEEALHLYEKAMAAGQPFDVIILDLTVRCGMGGIETMKRLLGIDPAVKAILSTGYRANDEIRDYRSYGFKAYLKKPYELSKLERVLNSMSDDQCTTESICPSSA